MMAWLFIFYYFFGVIFYDALPGPLQFIDEVFPWLLFALLLFKKRGKMPLSIFVLFGVFLFYLLYSLIIKSNKVPAILFDSIVQIKPFLAFYAVLCLKPVFSPKQKFWIRMALLCGAVVILLSGIGRIGREVVTVPGEVLSGARCSFAALFTGVSYLFFSNKKPESIVVSLILMSIGFCVPTSKFLIGIFLLLVLYFLTTRRYRRLRIPVIALTAVLCIPLAFSIAEDVQLYFSSAEVARAALLLTAGKILIDYVPFGSGLASFATSASANSYSELYYKYDINTVFGLSETDVSLGVSFISDAYLASMAQFGIFGILILLFFFVCVFKTARRTCSENGNLFLVIFIIIDMFIENIADSTMVGNRGVLVMMLLAFIVTKAEPESNHEEVYERED